MPEDRDWVAEGLRFIEAYVRGAVRKRPELRGEELDIVQSVHKRLLEELGKNYASDVAQNTNRQQKSDGPNLFARFRKVVDQVIDQARYQKKKQTQTLIEDPEAKTTEQDEWADLLIDVTDLLSEHEVKILNKRRERKTFREIGDELGLPHQKVHEDYQDLMKKLLQALQE